MSCRLRRLAEKRMRVKSCDNVPDVWRLRNRHNSASRCMSCQGVELDSPSPVAFQIAYRKPIEIGGYPGEPTTLLCFVQRRERFLSCYPGMRKNPKPRAKKLIGATFARRLRVAHTAKADSSVNTIFLRIETISICSEYCVFRVTIAFERCSECLCGPLYGLKTGKLDPGSEANSASSPRPH